MIVKVEKQYHNLSIKEFTKILNLSKKTVKAIKGSGDFLVNNTHQTVRYLLQEGDVLEVVFPKESTTIIPTKMKLDILFEDDYYLIVNKPKNMACIPTKKHYKNSLSNGLIAYFKENEIDSTIHLVNRLDKDTQGLLVIAKSQHYHALLSTDIKQVKRVYHCLVEGQMLENREIVAPIKAVAGQVKRIVTSEGKYARTHVRPLQINENTTLVECILDTGRTHQIRVHMKHIGHPLVGDELYGTPNINMYYLKSVEVYFVHPVTKQIVHIKSLP